MIRAAVVAAVALALAFPVPAGAAQSTITMSGSSVAQAVLADLAYFYGRATPGAPRFTLVGGGTTTGISDTARSVVDAGWSAATSAPGTRPGSC
jgi:ABC-type phosphate transport system substrate-binding protein